MPPEDTTKPDALARHGVLHPDPKHVVDPLFHDSSFFDPRDLVQVKYEMLRHVRVDGHTVSHAARAAGLSRPTYYAADSAFQRHGLPGLLPAKKGPRRAHKLSEAVLGLVEQLRTEDPHITFDDLAEALQRQLDLSVHPRSIERALARRKAKKGGP